MDENRSEALPIGEPSRNEEEKEFEQECGKETDEACDVGVSDGRAEECTDGCENNESVAEGAVRAPSDAPVTSLRREEEERADPLHLNTDDRVARERAYDELKEFFELFPEVGFSEIPRSVRESDLPLPAAYAIYERRERNLALSAERENEKNRSRSAGRLSSGGEITYTQDEVRRMTQDEVRNNFDAVMRSIKLW